MVAGDAWLLDVRAGKKGHLLFQVTLTCGSVLSNFHVSSLFSLLSPPLSHRLSFCSFLEKV